MGVCIKNKHFYVYIKKNKQKYNTNLSQDVNSTVDSLFPLPRILLSDCRFQLTAHPELESN